MTSQNSQPSAPRRKSARNRPVSAPAALGSPERPGGGLYIHVPFCRAVCSYCHFYRTADHDAALRKRTVAAIITELRLRRQRCNQLSLNRWRLSTAYIGGGTPSLLGPDLGAGLLAGTVGRLPAAPDLEVTVEANPESFDAALADAWIAAGVGRVSLGIQSLDARVLKQLGRRCTPERARAALALACARFPEVAADWLIGPHVNRNGLLDDLTAAVELGVSHISLYILELHAGTELAAAVAAGRVSMPSDPLVEALYLGAVDHLQRLGLRQYEVANFARRGRESRHNQAYWLRRPYLGLGPGAHGFYGRLRYANMPDLDDYLTAVESGRLPPQTEDRLTLADRRLEQLILPLRTAAGVPLDRIPAGALDLQRGVESGLWTVQRRRLRLTSRGFLRIDGIEAALARSLG
jgi:oxygen-independent coproporphyrinogen-3 oxidase